MTEEQEDRQAPPRCGFVAVIGPPNAGKSTLVNRMVGSKVSIVSPKIQTTRMRVMGIAMVGQAQLVLVNTPGIFAPKKRLEKAMVRAAWGGVEDADLTLLMINSQRGIDAAAQEIIDRLKKQKRRVLLVLNKIDTVPREKLLPLVAAFQETGLVDEVFMVSALSGDGVMDIANHLAARMPEGPWMFPEDQIMDLPMRLWAAEVTREKLFLRLHQELPYSIAVETINWEEKGDGSVRIDQTIWVNRERRRAMVLGEGGRMIKEIGILARTELEHALEHRVHLFLTVQHRENWQEDRQFYSGMNLDYNA